ncbi:hypothetical protein HYV98_00955 [Candidatus Azambacteria bacterium]|nr:hypothetical protein [Candidatus Azambacteria bacterium]
MEPRKSLFYLFSGLGILLIVGIWAWSVNRTIEKASGVPAETPAAPSPPQEVVRSLPSIGETIRQGLGSIREILEGLTPNGPSPLEPEKPQGVRLPTAP